MEPGKGTMSNTDDQLLVVKSTIQHRVHGIAGAFALKCAVDLGIPDSIHAYGGEPIPLPVLARSISVPPEKQPMLRRLMRLLSAQSVFSVQTQAAGSDATQDDDDTAYLLTPFSELLVTADDGSPNMSAYVRAFLDPDLVKPLHCMSEWLTQEGANATSFETAHGGKSLWAVAQERPRISRLFNEAMACDTRQTAAAVAACCPQVFCGARTLVDVGGGTGTAARMIAEAFPEMKCTVFDLPHVVAAAPKSDLFNVVAGDMFEYIPPADAVLLKNPITLRPTVSQFFWDSRNDVFNQKKLKFNILHDWNDEECVKILKQCKKATRANGDGGKVIIVDVVMDILGDGPQETEFGLVFDVIMMMGVGGKERNEDEWQKIFSEAGFANYKITPMKGAYSIIELFT
ncbi:Trans-resveratrol di-O-methyltransferase [Ananas comosus]|uniref:Trans-resveratrol di-O-methyltransferase n=1 Tax=Ananas comosus TaxID=4615 RepID=A0A199USA3_ANACO|nr:Trans-resveratrol di-O-methyltransferase [Ananas comosus]